MSELDRTALDRVLPSTPGAADWDDVLDRSRHQSKPRRRRAVALFSVVLVAMLSTSALAVHAFVLDKGFIGLPPAGATPSSPETGKLVMHWAARSVTRGGLQVRASVYADGRIIWSKEGLIPEGVNDSTSGYLEQRLTPDGVELLRARLLASGLFEQGLEFLVPREHLSVWGSVDVRDDERLVRVRWQGAGLDPANTAPAATPEQLSALQSIDPLISDPASELPPSAWADRAIRAYVPSHYAACFRTSPPTDALHILELLPTRARDLLRNRARTRSESEIIEGTDSGIKVLGREVTYCSRLATDEARDVAEALAALDPEPQLAPFGLAHRLAEPVTDRDMSTAIWFDAYLPHGERASLAGG